MEILKRKTELIQHQKEIALKNLRSKVNEQLALQHLTTRDYQLKMQEIKELEEN